MFLVGGNLSCGRCVERDGWGEEEIFLAASWSPVEDLLDPFIMSVSSLLQAFANSSSGLFKEMLWKELLVRQFVGQFDKLAQSVMFLLQFLTSGG